MVPKALGPSAVLPSGLRAALEMRAGLRPRPAAHPPREGGAAPERAEGQRLPMDPAGLLGLKEWVSTRQRANHAGPRSGPEGALPHTHAHARMRTYPHARTHTHARAAELKTQTSKASQPQCPSMGPGSHWHRGLEPRWTNGLGRLGWVPKSSAKQDRGVFKGLLPCSCKASGFIHIQGLPLNSAGSELRT